MLFTKLLILFHILIVAVSSERLTEAISGYFDSEPVKQIQDEWKKYKTSYENALRLVLNDVFSRPAINQYERRDPEFFKLTDGYHVNDNVVDLFLERPTLRELPRATIPMVSFALASNVILVDTTLGKMFVDTTYTAYRDENALVYQEPGVLKSPFSYQEVLPTGNLTITAEECRLLAEIVLVMSDVKVTVGHAAVALDNCKFNVEIFNPGFRSPPVIAPYFSAEKSKEIMRLLAKPIRDELVAKMQGAVLNYPATLQFTDPEGRTSQRNLIRSTRDYMMNVVRTLNRLTVKNKHTEMNLPDLNTVNQVVVQHLVVRGLDSAYAAHTGGPYRYQDLTILDAIKFDKLKVDGTVAGGEFELGLTFSADFLDVAADVSLQVTSEGMTLLNVAVTGWRSLEFSQERIPQHRKFNSEEESDAAAASVAIGYVSSELVKQLNNYLSSALPDALSQTNDEIGIQPVFGPQNNKLNHKKANDSYNLYHKTDDEDNDSQSGDDDNGHQSGDDNNGNQSEDYDNVTQSGDDDNGHQTEDYDNVTQSGDDDNGHQTEDYDNVTQSGDDDNGHQTEDYDNVTQSGDDDNGHQTEDYDNVTQSGDDDNGHQTEDYDNVTQSGDDDNGHQTEDYDNVTQSGDDDNGHQTEDYDNVTQSGDDDNGHQTEDYDNVTQSGDDDNGHQTEDYDNVTQSGDDDNGHQTEDYDNVTQSGDDDNGHQTEDYDNVTQSGDDDNGHQTEDYDNVTQSGDDDNGHQTEDYDNVTQSGDDDNGHQTEDYDNVTQSGDDDNGHQTEDYDNVTQSGDDDNGHQTEDYDNVTQSGDDNNGHQSGDDNNGNQSGDDNNGNQSGDVDNGHHLGDFDNVTQSGQDDNGPQTGDDDAVQGTGGAKNNGPSANDADTHNVYDNEIH